MSTLSEICLGSDFWIRFWNLVGLKSDSECWIWQGTFRRNKSTTAKYGSLKIGKKAYFAHRVSYTLIHGPIPEGLLVLHECDNPPCVNPAHLHTGTNHQNVLESVARNRRAIQDARPAHLNGTSSLTWDKVDDIRRRAALGESQYTIAASLGIGQSSVSRIVLNHTWKPEHRDAVYQKPISRIG